MKHFVIVKDGIARIMEAQDHVTDPMKEVAKWRPVDQAQVTSARAIDETDIPTARSIAIRNAWEDNGTTITVNMGKARVNKTNEIRLMRDERLRTLDTEYIRADETGDVAAKAAIAFKKRQLRDLPATIQPDLDAITTPEALEAFEPTWPA